MTVCSFSTRVVVVELPRCWRVMCSHWFAPKGEDNDKDCFCNGGRCAGFRGRFRDFASRADRAAGGHHLKRYWFCHSGVLASWLGLASSLLARPLGSSALLVIIASCLSVEFSAAPIIFRRGVCYFASHCGTRLSASLRAAGLVPPCALPDGSTVLTKPVRSLTGELAQSNS